MEASKEKKVVPSAARVAAGTYAGSHNGVRYTLKIEAAMAVKGLPIGISDGLAENRRFWLCLFPGLSG